MTKLTLEKRCIASLNQDKESFTIPDTKNKIDLCRLMPPYGQIKKKDIDKTYGTRKFCIIYMDIITVY